EKLVSATSIVSTRSTQALTATGLASRAQTYRRHLRYLACPRRRKRIPTAHQYPCRGARPGLAASLLRPRHSNYGCLRERGARKPLACATPVTPERDDEEEHCAGQGLCSAQLACAGRSPGTGSPGLSPTPSAIICARRSGRERARSCCRACRCGSAP